MFISLLPLLDKYSFSLIWTQHSWENFRELNQENKLCLLMLSHVQFFVTPWTVARQAPLSMGFSRQEYCSGLPCPPVGNLPNPGIKPMSLASPALAGRFFTTVATWVPLTPTLSSVLPVGLPHSSSARAWPPRSRHLKWTHSACRGSFNLLRTCPLNFDPWLPDDSAPWWCYQLA